MTSKPSSSATATATAPASTDEWPTYPGARELTSGHVSAAPTETGPGPHITWTAWFTSDAPERVVEHYRGKLGSAGFAASPTTGEWSWSRPDPTTPTRVLSINPSSARGPWSQVAVPANGTVIMSSHITTAKAPASSIDAAGVPAMKAYPWARLPSVEPIDLKVDRKQLDALGVRSFRAFATADGVRLWLLVFELESQPALVASREKILSLFGGAGENPPFSCEAAHTGAWLLIAGFPSSKPVSPSMDAAKQAALQRWAGEE